MTLKKLREIRFHVRNPRLPKGLKFCNNSARLYINKDSFRVAIIAPRITLPTFHQREYEHKCWIQSKPDNWNLQGKSKGFKTRFESSRVKLYRKWPEGKRKLVRVSGSSSYRGFELPRVKLQWMYGRIQGKLILVRVSEGWSYRESTVIRS